MKFVFSIFIAFSLFACTPSPKPVEEKVSTPSENITNPSDYNVYLNNSTDSNIEKVQQDYQFWLSKYKKDSLDFIAQAKMAGSHTYYFTSTGNIKDLKEAERLLIETNKKTNYNKAGYLRALAKNYISQHKFKEALSLLKKAEANGEDLENTQKMLFDVHLELGNSEEAKNYLGKFKNLNDFTYLIRTSKWNDHQGNLEAAIKYLEQATLIAEDMKDASLMEWCYTNLADYYGHAQEIEKSYNHYLKALKLNAANAYAKKGIAWIVYSKERNTAEASRILNQIIINHQSPDYYLLLAEIAEYDNDTVNQKKYTNKYLNLVSDSLYGDMYNKYKVLLLAEDSMFIKEALRIAKKEVENRPTPQSYDLLAWSHFKNGDLDQAFEIATTKVYQHTYEPEPLLRVALIAKAKKVATILNDLKTELDGTAYELGPLAERQIKAL